MKGREGKGECYPSVTFILMSALTFNDMFAIMEELSIRRSPGMYVDGSMETTAYVMLLEWWGCRRMCAGIGEG